MYGKNSISQDANCFRCTRNDREGLLHLLCFVNGIVPFLLVSKNAKLNKFNW